MRAVDIITDKRNGKELNQKQIEFLIYGYVKGEIPDYQVSAWAMAVFFQSMNAKETASLTETMLKSGETIDLSGIQGPFVDKHSTGGVGDKTSLILAPIVSALGIKVPMMSGRALGYTGGTLDKLESISGYRTNLNVDEFRKILKETGFAMMGQTKDIVPADRLLYALRDVTGTVESIPLITASILSKKVAEGAESLVFDVKYGSGAFMKNPQDAEKLARSLVDTGKAMGKQIVAFLTDMNEPLGRKVGNFLEIEESLDCLEGKNSPDLMEVTLVLASEMLVLGGKAKDRIEGKKLCEEVIKNGKAKELFLKNIESQGGNIKQFLEMRENYRSSHKAEIKADKNGFISQINAWEIGKAGVLLGVGRDKTQDLVSPVAGIEFHKKSGEIVKKGEVIMTVYGKDDTSLEIAIPQIEKAVTYSNDPPSTRTLVLKEIR